MFVVLVLFSTIRLFFPPFNDDLGTMPTRRPYSWKKKLENASSLDAKSELNLEGLNVPSGILESGCKSFTLRNPVPEDGAKYGAVLSVPCIMLALQDANLEHAQK